MKVDAARDVEPGGAVVQLVEGPPEDGDAMLGPMPEKSGEADREAQLLRIYKRIKEAVEA